MRDQKGKKTVIAGAIQNAVVHVIHVDNITVTLCPECYWRCAKIHDVSIEISSFHFFFALHIDVTMAHFKEDSVLFFLKQK